MRRMLFLVVWVLVMIFPVGWFVGKLPFGYHFFNQVFKYEWAHIAGHLVIFIVLGVVLSRILRERFPKHSVRYQFAWLFGIVIVVAAAQETFQIVTMNRTFGTAELFDFATDLLGALIGASSEQLLARFDGSLKPPPAEILADRHSTE